MKDVLRGAAPARRVWAKATLGPSRADECLRDKHWWGAAGEGDPVLAIAIVSRSAGARGNAIVPRSLAWPLRSTVRAERGRSLLLGVRGRLEDHRCLSWPRDAFLSAGAPASSWISKQAARSKIESIPSPEHGVW